MPNSEKEGGREAGRKGKKDPSLEKRVIKCSKESLTSKMF